jgi:plastocyanin
MKQKLCVVLGTLAMIVLAASCSDSNNKVTGPQPVPVGTPVPGMPTPTPVPAPHMAVVHVGQGGGINFVDATSGSSTTTIHAGDTVQWVWVSGFHSTTSGGCPGGACQADGNWDSGAGSGMTFTHTFPHAGTFPYHCSVHLAMMQGTVVVQ